MTTPMCAGATTRYKTGQVGVEVFITITDSAAVKHDDIIQYLPWIWRMLDIKYPSWIWVDIGYRICPMAIGDFTFNIPHIHKEYEISSVPHIQYPTYPYGDTGCRISAISIWYIGYQISPISTGHSGHGGYWISIITS